MNARLAEHMKISEAQWQGTRLRQEDAYAVSPVETLDRLLIVCDGMGGHSDGDVASCTAVEAFKKAFLHKKKLSVPDRLSYALDQANEAVGRTMKKRKTFGGTTLTAVCIGGGLLWWISVGDSPLFLWRRRHLARLNADHSTRAKVEKEYLCGKLNYTEYLYERNYLTSAVTGEEIQEKDLTRTPYFLLPGDRIVLSSDGVEPCLSSLRQPIDGVARILDSRAGDSAAALISYLRMSERAEYDNTTVIVADPF